MLANLRSSLHRRVAVTYEMVVNFWGTIVCKKQVTAKMIISTRVPCSMQARVAEGVGMFRA